MLKYVLWNVDEIISGLWNVYEIILVLWNIYEIISVLWNVYEIISLNILQNYAFAYRYWNIVYFLK